MDVADKLEKVIVSVAQDRFEAIGEEFTAAVVSPVEVGGVARQEALHHYADPRLPAGNEQVHVVGHECEGVALRAGLISRDGQTLKERFAVIV